MGWKNNDKNNTNNDEEKESVSAASSSSSISSSSPTTNRLEIQAGESNSFDYNTDDSSSYGSDERKNGGKNKQERKAYEQEFQDPYEKAENEVDDNEEEEDTVNSSSNASKTSSSFSPLPKYSTPRKLSTSDAIMKNGVSLIVSSSSLYSSSFATSSPTAILETRSTPNSPDEPSVASATKPSQPLASLPRFDPSAEAASRRNHHHPTNLWEETPLSIFRIRGAEYFHDGGIKVPSAPYLFPARGCDLFLTEDATLPVEDRFDVILGGRLRQVPALLINFRFPWGCIIFHFQVPEKFVPYMRHEHVPIDRTNLTVQEQVVAAWLQGDTDYRNERLKLIPHVTEGPWVVRRTVAGRPTIVGKKLPVSYTLQERGVPNSQDAPVLCATLDIGGSDPVAKSIVRLCLRFTASLTCDIGFCIQGQTPEELPEQMLGSVRVYGPDPQNSPQLR